ncbi:MAG: DUF5667 domain-containing protein [Desulfitobacteriaceae bacterium]|nr:DUF5667 domain-containing protein [Desulfitobacteriaceae bacterium]MDI6915425.1 DUF5667 domain-containing protein [Desulfitobacteriaceae bacterium]
MMKKPLALVLSLALSTIPLAVPAYADTLPTTDAAVTTTTTTTTDTSAPSEVITAVPVPDPTTATPTSTDGTTDPNLPPVQDSNGQTVDPGTLPDSPFYWLSNFIQKLQLALTFDPAQKAVLEERLALRKLAAAREMLSKGKEEHAQKAMQEYTEKITNAQEFLSKVKDPASEEAQKLQEALAQTDAKNIQVLSGLLEKLPPQAARKVALNVVRSMEKAIDKMEPAEKQELSQKMNKVAQKVGTKLDQETKEALTNFRKTLEVGVKEQKSNPGQEKKQAQIKQAEQEQDQEKDQEQKVDDKNTTQAQSPATNAAGQQTQVQTKAQTQTQLDAQTKTQAPAQNTQASSGNTVQTRPSQGGNPGYTPAQKEDGKSYGKEKRDNDKGGKSGRDND